MKQGKEIRALSMRVGDQIFGIDISCISDVLPRQPDTSVPHSGAHICGLINLRGHIVTLIHVRSCLSFTGEDSARMNIVIEYCGALYGLLCDKVGEIIPLNMEEMEPIPAVLEERWQGLAQGIFRNKESLMILLDKDRLIEKATPPSFEIGALAS